MSLSVAIVSFMAACSAPPSPTSTVEPPAPTATPSPTAIATPDAWAGLFRPLELPEVAPGARCPATQQSAQIENIGPILGDGPIYPAFMGPFGRFGVGFDESSVQPQVIGGQQWWGKKTLWLSDDTYRDIALVRGGRIDGSDPVLLYPGSGTEYVSALRLTEQGWVKGGSPNNWREWNSGTFYRSPGCYAFQIDGTSFTQVVVVEVLAHGGNIVESEEPVPSVAE